MLIQHFGYDLRVSRPVALSIGFFGMATPAQGVHDVWRGEATPNFGTMKTYEALCEAAPQLYIVLTYMVSHGLRVTFATDPIKMLSAAFSFVTLAIAITTAWRNVDAGRKLRLYKAVASSPLVSLCVLTYATADAMLRGLAISWPAAGFFLLAWAETRRLRPPTSDTA